jgi:hypothetical protein
VTGAHIEPTTGQGQSRNQRDGGQERRGLL